MLVYHPAFDIFHTVFRMMVLIKNLKTPIIELERFRMMDFYLAFPNELSKISFAKLGKELQQYKKVMPKEANKYEDVHDSFKTLERMRPYQMDAIRFLISYGYIDSEKFEKQYTISIIDSNIIEGIVATWEQTSRPIDKNALGIVTGSFSSVIFQGDKGLKAKTGLLIHRYDPKQ